MVAFTSRLVGRPASSGLAINSGRRAVRDVAVAVEAVVRLGPSQVWVTVIVL
jgi:hypothetical protein